MENSQENPMISIENIVCSQSKLVFSDQQKINNLEIHAVKFHK